MMRKTHTALMITVLCGSGLLVGFAAKRMVHAHSSSQAGEHAAADGATRPSPAPDGSPQGEIHSAAPQVPVTRSHDTAEILLTLDEVTLYPRLAAWLLDADEQEIATYWAGYQKSGNIKTHFTDLIFINWTRLNPSGAIAAAAGTKYDYIPWWAWTSHDPQAALTAALAGNTKMLNKVAWGIGGFHPDWLQEHLDQIPEANRASAFGSFKETDDMEDPLAALKFIRDNSMGFDKGIFQSLVREDPWAALDWIKENPSLQQSRFRSDEEPLDILLETMVADYPDDLERLIALTPSGEQKRKMEAALFDSLLTKDPEAAIAQAKSTEAAAIASERFAKIGLQLVKSDPDQAFEMMKNLFEVNPSGESPSMRLDYPNGRSTWGGGDDVSDVLVAALIARNPDRLMQMAAEVTKPGADESALQKVAWRWANHDLAAYAAWVNQQTDPSIRDTSIGPVVSKLSDLGQFSEAIEWAESSSKSDHGDYVTILYQWQKSDPAAASEWLAGSKLPQEEKSKLEHILKAIGRHNDE